MTAKNRPNRLSRGQSMVEFAITLVIILILLAGTVDLGRAFFTYMALRDAAQEGAVYASINPAATSAIIDRVRTNSSKPVDLSNAADVNVQVTLLGSACAGNGVKIDVTYQNFVIAMPLLGTVLGAQSFPIKASVTDTILMPPCQ